MVDKNEQEKAIKKGLEKLIDLKNEIANDAVKKGSYAFPFPPSLTSSDTEKEERTPDKMTSARRRHTELFLIEHFLIRVRGD